MKLNQFDRAYILEKIESLRKDKKNKIYSRDSYKSNEVKKAVENWRKAEDGDDVSKQSLTAKKLQAANSFINTLDIDIILIDDNIEFLKKILINNEY
jgi:hypothetical protein